MTKDIRNDFCSECRKSTEYILKKENIVKKVRDKEYSFCITEAICTECGAKMSLPGLIDRNIQEIDEQYRSFENLVTKEDIEKLMEIYNIGKSPLSLALGFGEITITRYLEGQIPSKEYSDIIKMAISSPEYMKKCLNENKDKIAEAAYNKAISAVEQIEKLFTVSDRMLMVLSYIFNKLDEVTPLALEKILYFIQGLNLALYDKPMFKEECRAWLHGPVYPEVYEMFRSFRYNPIDDPRFAIINESKDELTDEDRHVIDLVLNTFGMYSGKTLEVITHSEGPWIEARKGFSGTFATNVLLSNESISKYYKGVAERFEIDTEEGLNEYILSILNKG